MITCGYKKPGSWLLAILSTKRCFYAFLAHNFIKRRPIFLELFVIRLSGNLFTVVPPKDIAIFGIFLSSLD